MSTNVLIQLNRIRKHKYTNTNIHELGPLEIAKIVTRKDIERCESFCFNVIKHKPTFSFLANHQLHAIAQNVEKFKFYKGDEMIKQNELGNCCFILETGTAVSQTASVDGKTIKIEAVSKGDVIGDMCLFVDDPFHSTVIVTSEIVKVFVIRKKTFTELIEQSEAISVGLVDQMAKSIISKVRVFQKLSPDNRQKVITAMVPVVFSDNMYICRQGKLGKGFYVIVEGLCAVTINDTPVEKEIRVLKTGDYFGEISVMGNSNKSSANVIARGRVQLMFLCRNDFQSVLHLIENELQQQNRLIGIVDPAICTGKKANGFNACLRRISGVDMNNRRSDVSIYMCV